MASSTHTIGSQNHDWGQDACTLFHPFVLAQIVQTKWVAFAARLLTALWRIVVVRDDDHVVFIARFRGLPKRLRRRRSSSRKLVGTDDGFMERAGPLAMVIRDVCCIGNLCESPAPGMGGSSELVSVKFSASRKPTRRSGPLSFGLVRDSHDTAQL